MRKGVKKQNIELDALTSVNTLLFYLKNSFNPTSNEKHGLKHMRREVKINNLKKWKFNKKYSNNGDYKPLKSVSNSELKYNKPPKEEEKPNAIISFFKNLKNTGNSILSAYFLSDNDDDIYVDKYKEPNNLSQTKKITKNKPSFLRTSSSEYKSARGSLGEYKSARGSLGEYKSARGSLGEYKSARGSPGEYKSARGSIRHSIKNSQNGGNINVNNMNNIQTKVSNNPNLLNNDIKNIINVLKDNTNINDKIKNIMTLLVSKDNANQYVSLINNSNNINKNSIYNLKDIVESLSKLFKIEDNNTVVSNGKITVHVDNEKYKNYINHIRPTKRIPIKSFKTKRNMKYTNTNFMNNYKLRMQKK